MSLELLFTLVSVLVIAGAGPVIVGLLAFNKGNL
uniref:Hypothetical chloroplast RF12 n=1 Tax=Prasinococcus sp. CCMP1194 TaxID=110672 RepID=A0A088CI85_9VIRI|nr:hypothetical chloroplast RF12 [Prasinococcus sp. CCMP1194]